MTAALLVTGGIGHGVAEAAPVQFTRAPMQGWSTNGIVRAVLVVGDTVYAGGEFTQVRPAGGGTAVARARLAAFDVHTGALRTGFSADANNTVRSLETDGTRLFVGGSFTTIKGQNRSRLASVDLASGNVNTGFTANLNSHVYALHARGDRLFVGGTFATVGTTTRNRIAAVDTTTGTLDPTFNPNASGAVRGIVSSPDGSRLYVGGEFATIGGGSRQYIATLSPTTGALQPLVFQFSTFGHVIDLDISTSGDRIFAALGDLENQAIAWNTSNGTRAWRYAVDGDTQAVRYFNGNVYFGFHEGALGDFSVRMLAADAGTGVLVPDFRPTINSFYGVWDIDASNDALAIGGEFTNVAGVPVQGVAFFPTDGTPPPPPPVTTVLTPAGGSWRYLANGSNQGTAWRAPGFDDGTWPQGTAQLGYGDGDETTVVPFGPNAAQKFITTYFRQQFTVANPAALTNVTLQLQRDDGAVVYLNGNEVVRSNIGAGTVTSTTLAADAGGNENQFFSFAIPASALVAGTNTLAVEVHQAGANSSDLSFDLSLGAEVPAGPTGPAAPTNLRTTAVTGTSADLAWNAPGGAIASYRVYRGTTLVGSPTGTTFNDPDLTSAQTYSYTVSAVDGAGLESPRTAPLAVTTPDVIPPATPAGLAAPTLQSNRVGLTWNAATDNVAVTGYEVRRDGTLVGSPVTASFTDPNVTAEQTYEYTVVARDAAGNTSTTPASLTVTTPAATGGGGPPTVPTGLRVVSKGATELQLAWDASSDDTEVTGYVVSRSGLDLPSTSGTTLTDGLLAPGVTYTYTVRALDGAANESAPSTGEPVTMHLTSETTFPASSVWRYTDDGVNRGTAWRDFAYDDSTWKSGAGQLGYGDGDETTVMFNGGDTSAQRFISHYLRRSFTVTDATRVTGVTLSALRDDGIVVYVNGVEAFRNGMPTGTIANTTFANQGLFDAAENAYVDFTIAPALLREGTNVIAVSLHQNSRSGSADLGFDARLTTRYA